MEPTITAEDLNLYALDLLEGEERSQVDVMLRKSTAAREELASIRGDLALFALAAPQHTPPALTRQRLLKQVARERRTVPVDVVVREDGDLRAGQTFAADRGVVSGNGAPVRRSQETPVRTQHPVAADRLADPEGTPALNASKPPQTRTFPSRSQQMRAAAGTSASSLPVPRMLQEPGTVNPETAPAGSMPGADGLAGDPASFGADRHTFSPDPKVFPREARSLATTATAHSVTMFEQHFAAETAQRIREPELPPDPEAYSGRRRREPLDAISDVQDRFVPSGAAREEHFAFSSYRDRDAEEPRSNVFAGWMAWTGWAMAAALAVAAVFTLRDDFNLREQVSQQQSSLAAAEASAARAETVMQTLQSPASQHFLLARTDAAAAPSGRVAYLPERGTVVFQGSNLETLQPYKTYELWLIPAGEGHQPVPAGLFKPDGHGYATVVLPQLPKGLLAANFGVTIEDEGGSATPTLPILLVGQQT